MELLVIAVALIIFGIPFLHAEMSGLEASKPKNLREFLEHAYEFWLDLIRPYRVIVWLVLSAYLMVASCSAFAQTTADSAYANMQRAMGGIMQNVAAARGASTTDSRTYGTLYGMGKAAANSTAVGAAGTGLLVASGAVTAPAWGTILAVAAVSGAVSYAIALGIDAVVRWAFGSNSVTQANVYTMKFFCSNGATYEQCSAAYPNMQCSGTVNTANTQLSWIFTCTCATKADGSCGSSSTITPTGTTTTMANASTALTTEQKAQPVGHDAMAKMINYLWQKAAQRPDYTGLPYSATQPVTTSDVQTWATANPTIYPNVAALVAPVTDPSGFAPSTTTSTGSAVVGATSATAPAVTTTTTTTNSSGVTISTAVSNGAMQPVTVMNKVSVDLGVDPAIGSPTLEVTPAASDILAPVLNLVPSFKNFVVPSHTATCPAPTFDALGKHFVMDGHCTLFEQHRSTLYATMMLAFMLVAIFIVLSA